MGLPCQDAKTLVMMEEDAGARPMMINITYSTQTKRIMKKNKSQKEEETRKRKSLTKQHRRQEFK
ncbi:5897_t:CDS:2 [Funneliformis geosporum]|nr:5897_t:CDS:2 [Funneliformis geosporum]